MNYQGFIEEGLKFSLKRILLFIKENGIINPYHLYMKIDTANSLNCIPDFLKQKHPEHINIVIENYNYKNMQIFDEFFEIILTFYNNEHHLKIFYSMIYSIEDPEADFYLNFNVDKTQHPANVLYLDNY